ncbi:hypothetical protein R1sor_023343 [Riccia sorocarpa]|uniref:Uncharacterized protein n=1 Tax=Riccia sorocarpa TaxID=122646 RepID=A0ABD3GME5_9MARC
MQVSDSRVTEVEMGACPSVPAVVSVGQEGSEAGNDPSREQRLYTQQLYAQQMIQASKVWQPRGRTSHRILHRHHSVAATVSEGDDRLPVATRSLSLRDHFHSRFGDRLHHRFKPTPCRGGLRLRKRSMSVDIPGSSSPSGSELVVSSGGRSVVGRGHHGLRSGRCGPRHLGCHRRWFREMQTLAGEIEKELTQSKSSIIFQFSLDRTNPRYEAQQAAAASAADIVARLSLTDHVSTAPPTDSGMGMRMIEYEKPTMELEAENQQNQKPEVPVFEISNLTLTDAPVVPGQSTYGV